MSILQHFKHVPVKPESATDEQDEQLPEPNGCLSKSVPTKAIELANTKVLPNNFLGTSDHLLDSHGLWIM